MKKLLNDRVVSVSVVLLILIIWYLVTKLQLIDERFLPSPGAVLDALISITTEGYKGNTLLGHLGSSFVRLFSAFFLAILTAVPLGLVSGYNRYVRAAMDPIIEFYRPLPPLAYYTLLVLWLGIENESKITLLYLACFAPIYIACVAAVMKIPANYINSAATLGATKVQIFYKIIFPYCLPDMFTGIRTSMGVGYSTLVAAEMVAAVSGIGWLVLDASNWLRSDLVFAGIIVMGITGILIDTILRFTEKKLIPWKGNI